MSIDLRVNQNSDPRIKAAIIVRLMQSFGDDLSLNELPHHSQKELARAMGRMGMVDPATVETTISEFTMAVESIALPPPGTNAALARLESALSPEVAEQMQEEFARDNPDHAWIRLARLDDDKLARILEVESIEIAALLLSKLPVKQAARVLTSIAGERARRIACTTPQLDRMSAKAVQQIGLALADDHCNAPAPVFDTDAVGRVGAILNSAPSAQREDVLTGIESEDPDFAIKVRKAIFTFGNIAERIDPVDVPKIIKALDQDQLTLILAGAMNSTEDEVKSAEFLLENMSKRMAGQIRDALTETQTPKQAVLDELQGLLIGTIRNLLESGEISQVEE